MTAVADVVAGIIHAAIDIDASPDVVFDALTDPSQLAAWWGSADTYRSFDWKIDLRVGGAWSSEQESTDGTRRTSVRGRYLEIDRPRLLVYTWEPSWDDFRETVIRFELSETATGTRVKVTHSGFGTRTPMAHGHAEGWKRVLEWLGEHAGLGR